MIRTHKVADQITDLLNEGRLGEAIDLLVTDIEKTGTEEILEQALQLKEVYRLQLEYFAQGARDDQRKEQQDRLFAQVYRLNEQRYDVDEQLRNYTPAEILPALRLMPNDDDQIRDAFEAVRLTHRPTADDMAALSDILLDEGLPVYVRATLIGAMTLGLMKMFDADLAESLYVLTLDDQPDLIRMRAWATLVLVALRWPCRVAHEPRLREIYKLLVETDKPLLCCTQQALLLCPEAGDFEKKMHQIVSADDIEEETVEKEDGQKMRIQRVHVNSEKLREIFALVREGSDMGYESFRNLCNQHAFFKSKNNLHHWLMPFSTEQADVAAILERRPDSQILMSMIQFDQLPAQSDAYAMFLAMSAIDEKRISEIASLGEKMKAEGETPVKFNIDPQSHMLSFLHDLYRTYTLSRLKSRDASPFAGHLDMSESPWLNEAVSDVETTRRIAGLLLGKGRWAEATSAYQRLTQHEVTAENLQRLAYAAIQQQATGSQLAIDTLMRCRQLFGDAPRTICMLSDELMRMGRKATAEVVLHDALKEQPDNFQLLRRLAQCLTLQGRHEEALQLFYKADLQKEGQLSVDRGLAWCHFMMGNNASAERYARLLLARKNPTDNDWLNAGHIALQGGNIALAIERYSHIENPDNRLPAFNMDYADLRKAGIADELITLMRDTIKS